MKVTRKLSGKQILKNQLAQKKKNKRILQNNQQPCYAQILDQTVNNPYQFSFADYNRNQARINVLKTRFDDMIRINGVDLIYYRKFNTFFQQDQQNTANMIYGQDSTAQYYLSGAVRAFLQIGKQDFSFNLMGYQAQQQIDIWITIEDFRARFATVVGKVNTQYFMVPMTGDVYNRQYYGYIDIPQFYAEIYGQLAQNNYITNAYPEIKVRPLNSKYFTSIYRISNLQPLTGNLNGQLQTYIQNDSYITGYIEGLISYHSFENIQNSPSWNVAPQVGDYFKFKVKQIQQQYQINQVLDKQMTKDGLNPLLGRYLYRCRAVRRVPSEQVHNNIPQQSFNGQDINEIIQSQNINHVTVAQQQENYSEYTKKTKRKNKQNKRTNSIAKGIYNYQDGQDAVYGGYTENSPNLQIDYVRKT